MRLVEHGLLRTVDEPEGEVLFVSGAVASPQHGELRAQNQALLGISEHRAYRGHEMSGVLAPREYPDAARIVHVIVDHRGNTTFMKGRGQGLAPRLGPAPLHVEGEKLHEEPAMHDL